MKNQLLVLTALLALFASNSMVAMMPLKPLDPNKALDLQKLADSVKTISKQYLIPGQTGVYISPINVKELEESINSATAMNLKNEAIASTVLKESYMSVMNQLDAQIEKAQLNSKQLDELTRLLTRLYDGESYAKIASIRPGFYAGPEGRLFAFIANGGNQIQNLHAHLEPLLPTDGIAAHGGGVMTPTNEKMKHFIAYAIGKLVVYKNQLMEIPENTMKEKMEKAKEETRATAQKIADNAKSMMRK